MVRSKFMIRTIFQSNSRQRQRFQRRWLFIGALATICLANTGSSGFSQAQPAAPAETKSQKTTDEAEKAAWEFRPYQVAVWLCSDGSPGIVSNLEAIKKELVRQSELIDPSGWVLTVAAPPSQWRWAFINSIGSPEAYTEELPKLDSLAGFDKLMVVRLGMREGRYECQARELDIRTQQWGPIQDGGSARIEDFDSAIMGAISRAFMPIARVDRVSVNDEVFLRVRAMRICRRLDRTEDGGWEVNPNTDSPVWIDPNDRFLPVIRRTDRQGNLIALEPIDFTFLTIEEQNGPQSICSIQSYHRAPLAGRTSKRAQKLALVIRPPARSTVLRLVSRGDKPVPLEGYEIWSRPPGADRSESRLIGKTDWKGEFEVTPSESGMRILLIKHGERGLKKLPMIPGLHARLESTVPDDETRLYAEGIISGMQNEILNLVVQRQVYEAEIDIALKKNNLTEARELLSKYQDLSTPQELSNSLSDEESRLRAQTDDRRELEFISTMFNKLREILGSKIVESRESELRKRLQEAPSQNASGQAASQQDTSEQAESQLP